MRERRVIFLLLLIMTSVSLVVGGVAIYMLYRTAFAEGRARLVETVQSQARLLEAVFRTEQLDAVRYPDQGHGPEHALATMVDAHRRYEGFGETGEFTLARRDGEQIVFLLSHRHGSREHPEPIPLDSQLAEPMRQALSGASGALVGLDYRGVAVLAAHEPVADLDWGIVAKIDLAEVRAPFFRAGITTGCAGLFVMLAGAAFFVRIGFPLARRLEESEGRTRTILETAAEGIVTIDENGVIESVNNAAALIFGYEGDEVVGQNVKTLMPPAVQALHEDYLANYLRTGEKKVIGTRREVTGRRKDGTEFPMDLVVSEVRLGTRRLFTGIVRDITERIQAEAALLQEKQRLEAVAGSAKCGLLLLDRQARVTYANQVAQDWFGGIGRIRGKHCWEVFGGEKPEEECAVLEGLRTGKNVQSEVFAAQVGGEERAFYAVASPVKDGEGNVQQITLVVVDITDRKRAEEELKSAHAELNQVFNAAVPLCLIDKHYNMLRVNDTFCSFFGMDREDIVGRKCHETMPGPVCGTAQCPLKQILEGAERSEHGAELKLGDGRGVSCIVTTIPYRTPDGELVGIVQSFADITERKRAEEALQEKERFLSNIFASIQDGISILDKDLNIIQVNPTMERWYSHAMPLTGKKCYEAYHGRGAPCEVCPTRRTLKTGRTAHEVVPKRGPGGEIKGWMDLYSFPFLDDRTTRLRGVIEYVRDITKRKEAEQELAKHRDHLEDLVEKRTRELEASREKTRRAERLASIGTLAAGIAHEVNNPLGLIALEAHHARRHTDDSGAIEAALDEISELVERCARIVKSVLRFSREEASEKSLNHINEIIFRAMDMTREYAKRHAVALEFKAAKDLPPVVANSTELEQVFVNLIHNAVHACREGGCVAVETQRAAGGVRAVVLDDGCGMTEEQKRRVFDPFYTTRPDEGGSGLGLSTCHGIVTEHRGTIEIESRQGEGTTITVDLPIGESTQ